MIAIGLALVALVALPTTAHADEDDWKINRYEVVADAAESGVIKVTATFDFDFADTAGHGPYMTIPVLQEIEGDPDHYRKFIVSDVSASSPTGAPTSIDIETEGRVMAIRIGDENKEVEGVQTYEVTYTINGIANPGAGENGEDEIFWNIISDWDVPLNNVTMHLNGPVDATAAKCFAGDPEANTACGSAEVDGKGATFTQDMIDRGDGLTIATAWPGGTFPDAEPMLTERRNLGNTFSLSPVTAGLGGLIAVLGGVGFGWIARRKGRDQEYQGLTPGLTPGASGAAAAAVGPRSGKAPVAVQFTPPKDARPGAIGTLADGVAGPEDVTATIVDLAVRGHLRIEETEKVDDKGKVEEDEKDWRLVKLKEPSADLASYETNLINGLFPDDEDSTQLSDLAPSFYKARAETQTKLYEEVTSRGWYVDNPQTVRIKWYALGILIALVGIGATIALALTVGWGLVGVGIFLVGVVAIIVAGRMPARTAEGSAVLAQTQGFRQYLETAEAEQIKFEEGEDIFSRYLPYAIVFGVAERWATVFADLAAQGRDVPEPTWYVGPYQGAFFAGAGMGSFTDSLSSFTDSANASMSAPTSGSSGGSGFSGGSVGGGVGGGGGGGW